MANLTYLRGGLTASECRDRVSTVESLGSSSDSIGWWNELQGKDYLNFKNQITEAKFKTIKMMTDEE